jgi:hypothetical protein
VKTQSRSLRHATFVLAVALCSAGPAAHAKITKIVIDRTTSPAFGGATFGNAGQFETPRRSIPPR